MSIVPYGQQQSSTTEKSPNDNFFDTLNILNWGSEDAKKQLESSISEFKRIPDILAPQGGGIAKWKKSIPSNYPFLEYKIMDIDVIDDKGVESKKHCVHAYIRFPIVPKCYQDLASLKDKRIKYKMEKQIMCARGSDLPTVIALLMIGTSVATCIVDASRINSTNAIEKSIHLAHNEEQKKIFLEQIKMNMENNIMKYKMATGLPWE